VVKLPKAPDEIVEEMIKNGLMPFSSLINSVLLGGKFEPSVGMQNSVNFIDVFWGFKENCIESFFSMKRDEIRIFQFPIAVGEGLTGSGYTHVFRSLYSYTWK